MEAVCQSDENVIAGGLDAHQDLVRLSLALSGPSLEKLYTEFCGDPQGQRILQERPDLCAALSDREALAAMPDGSFGRAYLASISQYRFDAKAFDAMTDFDGMAPDFGWDEQFVCVIAHGAQMHDLWHVLGGWGPDLSGDVAATAFLGAVVPMPGIGFISNLLLFTAKRGGIPLSDWQRLKHEAAGQRLRSKSLLTAPWEELLPQQLTDVRASLGLLTPEQAHPLGVSGEICERVLMMVSLAKQSAGGDS